MKKKYLRISSAEILALLFFFLSQALFKAIVEWDEKLVQIGMLTETVQVLMISISYPL